MKETGRSIVSGRISAIGTITEKTTIKAAMQVGIKKTAPYLVSGIVTGCAVLGWWGALYPRFTLLDGTYEIIYEGDNSDMSKPAEEDKDMLYWQILGADRSQIRVKSRIWEEWKALKKAGRESYESGD
ncbi:MAG: hypothetical protein IJ794_12330 [Lachnospiraceae bacterium]|nr:hypothetical protein [Lachnospiraceae bacterium]